MVSIWWIVFALLAGVYAGAILVSVLTINSRETERAEESDSEQEDVRLVA